MGERETKGKLTAGLDLPGVANNDPDPRLIWADSRLVADCRWPWVSEDHAAADARRLAACWNALAGVSTEAIEAGAVGRLVEALAAITAAVEMDCEIFPGQPHKESALGLARAALAPFGPAAGGEEGR